MLKHFKTYLGTIVTKCKLKKSAFTLAEVLITLTIIGVIAALTIPGIIGDRQKRANITALKKAQSILSSAVSRAVMENGEYDTWNVSDGNIQSTKEVFSYIEPYLQISKKCINTSGCWATKTYTLGGQPARWSSNGTMGWDAIAVTLTDGMNVSFDINTSPARIGLSAEKSPSLTFFVDVNGFKNPNMFGIDIFGFVLSDEGIIPFGNDNHSVNCNKNSRSDTAGYDCAYRALQEDGIKYY